MKLASSKVSLGKQAQSLQQELAQKFPDITVSTTETKIYLRGAFPVLHEGNVLDRYQVEIDWSDRDTEVPVLRETGGRIPWIADRHMSQGGMACLFVPEEWLLRARAERTIIHYLDGPVRNYFLWQSLFERGESPPWGERSHGVSGLIEAYSDMVSMQGAAAVKRCFGYLSRDRIKGHWMCPCGTNRRVRDCHIEHLRELKRKIPRYIAVLALKRLKNPVIR
jgi:hypothetical protein